MAWYRTGTVSLTNGSSTVTGSGTAFIANAGIGEAFIAPDGRTYEITNVTSDAVLTISPAYLGSTASGQSYAIAPLRGRIADLIAEASSLLSSFATVRDGIGAGLFPDGTVSLPGLRFASDQDTGLARVGTNAQSLICGGVRTLDVAPSFVGLPTNVSLNGSGTSPAAFEVGINRTGDGTALIDLHSAAGQDFNARMFRDAGANGSLQLINTGTGNITFNVPGSSSAIVCFSGALPTFLIAQDGVNPVRDNVSAQGSPGSRWTTVFAATGTINTSDARDKVWRGAPDDAALRAANRIIGELGFFQWAEAVEEKGEDGARIHFGVKAQDVVRVMMEEGLEAEQDIDLPSGVHIAEDARPRFRHAFLCFDTWDDDFVPEYEDVPVEVERASGFTDANGNPLMRVETRMERRPTGKMIHTVKAGNRFGLRVDHLTMFLLAALASRVAALEATK